MDIQMGRRDDLIELGQRRQVSGRAERRIVGAAQLSVVIRSFVVSLLGANASGSNYPGRICIAASAHAVHAQRDHSRVYHYDAFNVMIRGKARACLLHQMRNRFFPAYALRNCTGTWSEQVFNVKRALLESTRASRLDRYVQIDINGLRSIAL